MKTKLLLYCTKRKPYLYIDYDRVDNDYCFVDDEKIETEQLLNGKIVAECECEVEKIKYKVDCPFPYLEFERELPKTCLTYKQLEDYLFPKSGYALHLTNIKAFEKPLTIEALYQPIDNNFCKGCKEYNTCEYAKSKNKPCKKVLLYAPQNMCWVWYNGQKYCLISIRPEWLCKILNGEKPVEVRRKILKGMM